MDQQNLDLILDLDDEFTSETTENCQASSITPTDLEIQTDSEIINGILAQWNLRHLANCLAENQIDLLALLYMKTRHIDEIKFPSLGCKIKFENHLEAWQKVQKQFNTNIENADRSTQVLHSNEGNLNQQSVSDNIPSVTEMKFPEYVRIIIL